MSRNALYWLRKLIETGEESTSKISCLNEKDSQFPGGFHLTNHEQSVDIFGMSCKDEHLFGEMADGIA